MREIIGSGTLLAHADLMFGESAKALTITFNESYSGFLLAILPPGAFFGLALLIAFKNVIGLQIKDKAAVADESLKAETA
jgi:electron transport complex protein RnfE